jgi:hypothetical protein
MGYEAGQKAWENATWENAKAAPRRLYEGATWENIKAGPTAAATTMQGWGSRGWQQLKTGFGYFKSAEEVAKGAGKVANLASIVASKNPNDPAAQELAKQSEKVAAGADNLAQQAEQKPEINIQQ